MSIPASTARQNLFPLIKQVNDDQEAVLITSNAGNAVLVSESEWENMLETFYLLVFAVLFRVSSLIWGFAIYFIIWHSIPSIINQVNYLSGEFNKKNFGKYIKSAFVYWMISLIGIATLYLLFKDIKIFNALFFSFLAAITFPHVLVIFILFKKK